MIWNDVVKITLFCLFQVDVEGGEEVTVWISCEKRNFLTHIL